MTSFKSIYPFTPLGVLTHFLIHCTYYKEIREHFLPRFLEINVHLAEILEDEGRIMLSILDPLHSKLQNIAKGWTSSKEAYTLSGNSVSICTESVTNFTRKRTKQAEYLHYCNELICYWSKDGLLTLLIC